MPLSSRAARNQHSPKGCRHPGRRLPTEPLFPSRPSRPHGRPIRRRPSPTVIFAPAKAKQGSNRARPLVAGDPTTICPLSFGPQAPAPSHPRGFRAPMDLPSPRAPPADYSLIFSSHPVPPSSRGILQYNTPNDLSVASSTSRPESWGSRWSPLFVSSKKGSIDAPIEKAKGRARGRR